MALGLKIVTDDRYIQHLTGAYHPEQPMRTWVIADALKKSGLLNEATLLSPRKAILSELRLCHQEKYIHLVEIECLEKSAKEGSTLISTGDAQICPVSYDIACLSAGGVLTGIDALFKDNSKRVFCVVRPPGHHACTSIGMGFCLFNNAAIGARYAQQNYGVKRVLIVDWDVHHGNGTQEIFYDDPSVFYFSTHQYPLYPGTGAENEKGVGLGKGFTMNVPIAAGGHSRIEVLEAFTEQLSDAMKKFKPELVIISCGFDAHERDPLGGFTLRDEDFEELTKVMVNLANRYAEGRIISVLEGGYDLEALKTASISHVRGLIS